MDASYYPGPGYADHPGPCPVCRREGQYVDIGFKEDQWPAFAARWARPGDHIAWCMPGMLSCMDWPTESSRKVVFWNDETASWQLPPITGFTGFPEG